MVAVRGAPVPEAPEEPRVRLGAEQKLAAPVAVRLAVAEKAAAAVPKPLAWKAAAVVPVAVPVPRQGGPPRRPLAAAGLRC